jgi:arylsulfatase A-like enzyme
MQSGYHFSSFMVGLEELGLLDDTIVVFLADHGESWGERFEDKTEVKGTYHMHGANLYEEIVRVPFLVSAPGLIRPDTSVASQVSLVDLMPTLVDFMGADVEMLLDGLDGKSLKPLVLPPEVDEGTVAPTSVQAAIKAEVRPAIIVGTDKGAVSQMAVREFPWKLIHHLESGEYEAYDIRDDPGEVQSIVEVVPEKLREILDAEVATISGERLSAEEEALVEGRLRDLGYL